MESGEVPLARLNDMVHRILRTDSPSGVVDNPPVARWSDVFQRPRRSRSALPSRASVLLKNANGQLPLNGGAVKSIAVIGSHADAGVLSGGGSAQVDPPGGNAVAAVRRTARGDAVLVCIRLRR